MFFAPEPPLARLLPGSDARTVVVPPLPLLFQSKALAASARSAVRDWVDLYVLMRRHGFTIADFAAAYQAAGSAMQLDIALDRLTSGRPRAGDPGVEGLMAQPPGVDELALFFRDAIADWKRETAARALSG